MLMGACAEATEDAMVDAEGLASMGAGSGAGHGSTSLVSLGRN
eukprot:CAMPEP_0114690488 /NCGR_PEP_ID=MMETSP0191-20121206/65761_1 /TAXON_ID=126664 /ORGANISM="Sorites sp." /LENGTH=42 /DNA_ID= /DNA_START= /DNA_END= /DNA_ORIENTATION=